MNYSYKIIIIKKPMEALEKCVIQSMSVSRNNRKGNDPPWLHDWNLIRTVAVKSLCRLLMRMNHSDLDVYYGHMLNKNRKLSCIFSYRYFVLALYEQNMAAFIMIIIIIRLLSRRLQIFSNRFDFWLRRQLYPILDQCLCHPAVSV